MILEEDYSWSQSLIGVVVGVCFLVVLPFRLLFSCVETKISLPNRIRLLQMFCIVGSILLYPGSIPRHPVASLVLADSILFPAFMLVSGLAQGLIMTFAMPNGYLLSENNMIPLTGILVAVGRFLGPPMARWAIDNGGQDHYAMQQIILTIL